MNKTSVNTAPVFTLDFVCSDEECSGQDGIYASYDAAMEQVNELAEERIEELADEGVEARLFAVRVDETSEAYAVLTEEEIVRAERERGVPDWIDELFVIEEVHPR